MKFIGGSLALLALLTMVNLVAVAPAIATVGQPPIITPACCAAPFNCPDMMCCVTGSCTSYACMSMEASARCICYAPPHDYGTITCGIHW